jgi:myosin heavy subunit
VSTFLTSIQGQISEVTKSLDDARNAVPDFGPEKARIEADVSSSRRTEYQDPADHQKAKKQIEDAVVEKNDQVRKLCTSFRNEQVKLRTMKEEVERDLAARNETIKNMQAQLDRLKEEYGNRSPAAWSGDIEQKDAEIKRLIDQSTEARHRFEKLQQDFDQTRRSAESSLKRGVQELQQRDAQIETLNETSTAAHDSVKSLEQELAEVKRSKEATLSSLQEDATRKSQDAQDRLKAMEIRLSEVNSAKLAAETRFSDHEKRSSDEAGQRQKDISDLRRHSESASRRLKKMDERHTQQEEVLRQKDSDSEKLQQENEKLKQDIDKLQQELAKAASNAVQIPNSQPQEDVQDQTSTSSTKKGRKAVDRSGRSASKPTSSVASAVETQPTSDVLESTQPRSTGASIFGPFSQPRSNSYNTRRDNSTQEDDEMLDTGNSQLSFLKPTSRPASSQSEAQRAFSLGSQEVLTAEGVRFRSQNNQRQAETQPRPSEHISPSSSLSEPRDLDGSYRNAALEESQSQERTQGTQQQSQQRSQDVELQSQQQSLGLSVFDDLAVGSHAFETPMKASGRNLQGMGKKLTPRPESQPRQSKPGALQPITTPNLPRGSAVNSRQQKKVSALSSGPHNFKTGSSGKGKRIAFNTSDAEEGDDDDSYSPPNSSARGSRSPQKRPAPQSSKTNKRQRTETATPAPASQRSTASTPRRSQTTSATPGRRRSSRTSKWQ